MLSQKDSEQLNANGITSEQFADQIKKFRQGIIPARLIAAAQPGNGIILTTEKTRKYYLNLFDDYSNDRDIVKFVPASGAASRMFKDMYSCLHELQQNPNDQQSILDKCPKVKEIFSRINEFAFYPDLFKLLQEQGMDLHQLINDKKYDTIISFILNEKGLNYGNLPKALLNFHDYSKRQRKAIDEHLVEGVLYAINASGLVNIHFTISPEHEEEFNKQMAFSVSHYEHKFGIRIKIDTSYQHPSTDTIAVDMNNDVCRNTDNSIVFRPAGHGALIKNLNELSGDLIFIKNIDNITTDRLKPTTTEFKKVMAGILIDKEISINGNLAILMDDGCSTADINEIASFVINDMLVTMPPDFQKMPIDKQRHVLINKLNKPIRVCGMVRNEGEPGGGPFFVENSHGITSLQIVESAQVDMNDPEQVNIFKQSTHFNPVDIVANTVDFLGRKFNLNDFVDHDTYMISEKSMNGKPIKALELPGLWNGAMAGWITYFVEVPLETFSPVKEINDLLREPHKS